MGIRSGFKTLVIGYRRTARLVAVGFIILAVFAPFFVNAASPPPASWGLIISGVKCPSDNALLSSTYYFSAVVGIVGPPATNAQLALSGKITWFDANMKPITSASPTFSPNNFAWPGTNKSGAWEIDSQFGYSLPSAQSCAGWITLSVNGFQQVNMTLNAGQTSATFQLLAALPEFNDTSFGATAHCPPTLTPCQIPVGDFYNFIAGISLGLAVLGFMLSYASNSMRGKDRIPFVDLMITILFIVAFPYIYNEVATLVNYLNMALVSGPGNDYTSYAGKISQVWAATGATTQSGLWGFLTNPLVQLAAWVVDFIVYIGSFILGTIRVLLIAVMVVAFPISLALKEVPFTKKLGQMVEDTLFGLILASIMSSIVLGLAAYILGTGTNGTVFQGSDIWFAAISLLAALMLPTVFAPLTGVMFQTGMQAAMAAGTAAVLAGSGGAMGAVGGIQSMGQMANAAGGLAGSVGRSSGSIGTRLASSMQHGSGGSVGFGVLQGLKGAGAGLAMGTFYGMGMRPVAYFARSGMRSPGQIVREQTHSMQQASQAMQVAQMQQEAETVGPDLVKHASSVISSGLSGRTLDFSWATNSSGQHFRMTQWTDPQTGAVDYNAASKWRDSMLDLSANKSKLGYELASHHLVTPEMAKNDLLMDSVGRQLHDRLSAVDPKTDEGVKALLNLKNTIDSNQFLAS
ncbi:MAG: hypothetical protein JRN06_00195 [Nitrososphaerota archaeon]|nr:hypothetical protein [Nitrososphaerota archaeon]MDG7023728.1 hypothetical protein [Nitrososphaerota archaeon]